MQICLIALQFNVNISEELLPLKPSSTFKNIVVLLWVTSL